MKKHPFFFILIFLLCGIIAYAKNLPSLYLLPKKSLIVNQPPVISALTGTTWKVKQLFVDSVLVNTPEPEYSLAPVLDSVTYSFNSNGQYTILYGLTPTVGNWEINSTYNQITIRDLNAVILETMTILYIDPENLIYTVQSLDVDTNEIHLLEFRLVPDTV